MAASGGTGGGRTGGSGRGKAAARRARYKTAATKGLSRLSNKIRHGKNTSALPF